MEICCFFMTEEKQSLWWTLTFVLCLTLQIFKQIKHLTSCRRPNFWRTSIRRHWTPWKKRRTNDCGLRRIRSWENCISIERIGRDCRRFWSSCTAPVRWRLLLFWSHLLPFAIVLNVKPLRNACRINLLRSFWLPSLWIVMLRQWSCSNEVYIFFFDLEILRYFKLLVYNFLNSCYKLQSGVFDIVKTWICGDYYLLTEQTDDGEDDMKKGTQLLEIYALEIQMYTAQKNNKKLKVIVVVVNSIERA